MDSAALVTYSVTEAEIAKTREACASLTCDTPDGYEAVRVAIGNLRTTRGAIERRRVELKADALKFGRLVDSEAARFTGLIQAIEDPLKAKKAVIDDEADRVKREKEAAALKKAVTGKIAAVKKAAPAKVAAKKAPAKKAAPVKVAAKQAPARKAAPVKRAGKTPAAK